MLQTKISPHKIKSIATLSFHNILTEMTVIISLKMSKTTIQIFFESGFSDGNHCLK